MDVYGKMTRSPSVLWVTWATSPSSSSLRTACTTFPEAREKLAHELSDCLWSVIVLAHNYGFDLETVFMENMEWLSEQIEAQQKQDR
jgi:NTP pyrophosphatase (non-canonical NTP hydrolase)